MLTSELLVHEYLEIFRLRKKMSQSQFALQHGIDYTMYRKMEKGEISIPSHLLMKLEMPQPISDREKAIVARKRLGMTQDQLADRLRVSRGWVCAMENSSGNPAILIDFWKNI